MAKTHSFSVTGPARPGRRAGAAPAVRAVVATLGTTRARRLRPGLLVRGLARAHRGARGRAGRAGAPQAQGRPAARPGRLPEAARGREPVGKARGVARRRDPPREDGGQPPRRPPPRRRLRLARGSLTGPGRAARRILASRALTAGPSCRA